jgi:putative ABC transport system permease protein
MKTTKPCPPKSFLRFFRWYCDQSMRDYIEGDLMEVYSRRLKQSGKGIADLKFIIDVVFLFRPGIIRSPKNQYHMNPYGMYKNYFKLGWRNLLKNKGYSFINIGGLALGMTIATLIGLWIYDELSYNRYHAHHDDIAQVWSGSVDTESGEVVGGMALQFPVATVLTSDYSQHFKHVLQAWWPGDYVLNDGVNKFSKRGQFIGSNVIDMLSLNMISGNANSLKNTNSIILSQRAAVAIFGDEDPMHKTFRIDNKMEAEVTGVYKDLPHNNRFAEFEFFAPYALWESANPWMKENLTDWDNRNVIAFVQIDPNTTFESVNKAIKPLYSKHVPADFYKTIEKYQPFVQLVPMSSWHLYSEIKNGKPSDGRITYVWLFGVIGAFVLLLACINFVNLSIARSEKRAREVGVRKTIGSDRGQLIIQFFTESFLVVVAAFILSLALGTLLLQPFNELADKKILLPLSQPVFWIIAAVFVFLTGLLSGIYPAFYLSSFRPVAVLKGVSRAGGIALLPRKALVVIQFSVSVVLMVGTIIVYKQIEFARNRPVGYDRNGLVMLHLSDPQFNGRTRALRTELLNTGVVSEASVSSSPLTAIWNNTGGYEWQGKDPNFEAGFAVVKVSMEFGETAAWEIAAGRDYSAEFAADSVSSIVINQAAADYMGFKDAVGKELTDVDEFGKKKWTKTIIGVVKNLLTESPYEPVQPTLYIYQKDVSSVMTIRLNPNASAQIALPKIKNAIEKIVPTAMFDYKFLDDEYAKKFSQEERVGKLAGVFSVLAIFISCLGLFGLSSFIAEQRTREIGIRKVMGASVTTLWKLMTTEFVVMVLVSFVISIPLAYYLMNNWLEKYEYHTETSAWVFLVTCISALGIALLTVSFQAIRTARMNPVKNLRSE